MPEKEITKTQFHAIIDWAQKSGGMGEITEVDEGDELFAAMVQDEPLIFKKVTIFDNSISINEMIQQRFEFDHYLILYCSERHAKSLEQTGIVSFSESADVQ